MSTLAEAQAIIAAAAAEERAKEISRLTDQLTEERTELRRRRERLTELRPHILEHRKAAEEARSAVMLATQTVGKLQERRPAVADWLKGDPEVVAWQLAYTEAMAELDRLSVELKRLSQPHPDEAEAARLSGMGPDSVKHSEWVVENLLAQLDRLKPQPVGRSTKAWAHNSGISGVLG